MKTTLLTLTFMLAAALSAPAQLSKLTATKANDYGIVYGLPKTSFVISLTAKGTTRTPGEFYNYADRYLGPQAARQAIAKASSQWEITGAELHTKGVPQTAGEQYLVQLKSGSPVYMVLNEQGIPLSIGTETEPDPTTPLKTPEMQTIGGLNSTAARYAMSEDMVQSSSTAKRAALAAAKIMELRQSRQDYLTGQADVMPDGKALELILSNINEQEEALTAMFLGTTTTTTASTTVEYTPGDKAVDDVVIARLSAVKGFVDAADLSGDPIYLSLKVVDRGVMPKNEKGEPKKLPKNAVAYCIPGTADVTLDFRGRKVLTEKVQLAQLGVVYGLDPDIFTNKKTPGYAIFDPATGGIREVGTKQEL